MGSFLQKVVAAIEHPVPTSKKIKKKADRLYKFYIRRDEFLIAHSKWVRDKGDETLRLSYDLDADSVVFDLGGYRGDFAHAIYSKYGSTIYVFEPVREFFHQCEMRFQGVSKISCSNFGLSDCEGTFFISNEQDASSVVNGHADDHCEEITLGAFRDQFELLNLEQIDLLKINIEGGEYGVLKHVIETGLIHRIRHIQVQFHNFIPNAVAMRNEIRNHRATTHTESWNYPFVWESWERKLRKT